MTSRRAFGDALRRHREQRGIALETISELTKISVALLGALERGDCSRWPGGIYSRAYVRDYAQAVGLDRDETVAKFTECFAETAFPEGPPAAREAARTPVPPSSPFRLTFDEPPGGRRRILAHRAAAAGVDLFITLVLATAISLATDVGWWMAVAGMSVAWHAIGVLRGGSHGWELLAGGTARRQPRRTESAVAESPLAEAT